MTNGRRQLLGALALLAASVAAKKITFDDADQDQSRTISRPEWDTYVVPYLLNDYKPNPDSLNPSGALNRLFHPTLEEVVGEDLSFGSAFFNSWSLIIATELGDKTFFIAAILCLRFSRLPVFLGALSALIIMTALSAIMGIVLPAIMSRKYTHFLASLLFFYFGLKLLHDSREMQPGVVSDELAEVEEELNIGGKKEGNESTAPNPASLAAVDSGSALSALSTPPFDKIFTQSLSLTFLAEWGDRSQIATVALASHKEFFGVILGGCIGHAMCTGLACVGGKMLATKISEKSATIFGGSIFLVFGVHSLFFEEV